VAGAIRGALDALIADLVKREYTREDGATLRIRQIFVDSGDFTDVVYQCCRESPHAGMIVPTKGMGIKCDRAPISEWKKHEGQTIGEQWMLGKVENRRAVRLLTFDTNFWKTRLFQGLTTAAGDRGCITLFGERRARGVDHSMLIAHLLAETRDKTFGRGRTVYVYKLRPEKPDNHLLDCFVGNLVNASALGCRVIGKPIAGRPKKPPRPRQPVAPLNF
jgi:phage terminase large subunit GpA-like protein